MRQTPKFCCDTVGFFFLGGGGWDGKNTQMFATVAAQRKSSVG